MTESCCPQIPMLTPWPLKWWCLEMSLWEVIRFSLWEVVRRGPSWRVNDLQRETPENLLIFSLLSEDTVRRQPYASQEETPSRNWTLLNLILDFPAARTVRKQMSVASATASMVLHSGSLSWLKHQARSLWLMFTMPWVSYKTVPITLYCCAISSHVALGKLLKISLHLSFLHNEDNNKNNRIYFIRHSHILLSWLSDLIYSLS